MGARAVVLRSLRGLALAAALMQAGCAFVAAAARNHGRSGGCQASPAPGGIDLVLATAGAAGFLASGKAEEQPAYLIIPGVFLMSGLIGSVSAYSCRSSHDGAAEKAAPIYYPSVDPTPPEEPSTARDGTAEELGIPVPVANPPNADLRLDPNFTPPAEPTPAKPENRVACQIRPLTACPPDHSCVLVEGERGYCVPDR